MRPRRIRPGNQIRSLLRMATCSCFNEAEANPPRKSRPRVQLPVDVREASMRPRRIRPGNNERPIPTQGGPVGFNEAEANPPRK